MFPSWDATVCALVWALTAACQENKMGWVMWGVCQVPARGSAASIDSPCHSAEPFVHTPCLSVFAGARLSLLWGVWPRWNLEVPCDLQRPGGPDAWYMNVCVGKFGPSFPFGFPWQKETSNPVRSADEGSSLSSYFSSGEYHGLDSGCWLNLGSGT